MAATTYDASRAAHQTRDTAQDERSETLTASDQMKTRADAGITVHKYEPVAYEDPAEGPVLTRIHVKESTR